MASDTARPAHPRPRRRPESELLVARRYLDHGFLDAAMRLFARHAAQVPADDWRRLVDRLLERQRMPEAIRACRLGRVPLPRAELLALGDRHLRLKDVDAAIHYYQLADADHPRWAGLVDVLTGLPGRELQAVELAERHLVSKAARAAAGVAAAG
jgi:hypothetical protein